MPIQCVMHLLRRWVQTVGFAPVRGVSTGPFLHQVQPSFRTMAQYGLTRRFCTSHRPSNGALAAFEADLSAQSKCAKSQARFPVLI